MTVVVVVDGGGGWMEAIHIPLSSHCTEGEGEVIVEICDYKT